MIPIPIVVGALCLVQIAGSPHTPPSVAPTAAIVLDSRFEDWAAIPSVLVDAVDAPDAFVDLGEVRIAADENFVHMLIDFGRTVNVQGLDGTADILLNADGDEGTGATVAGLAGVDMIVRCTPPDERNPARPGRGMAVLSTTYTHDREDPNKPAINPYDVGLAFAPTHSGRRMEFRLQRGLPTHVTPNNALPPLFVGSWFSGKVVFKNLDGTIGDETDTFTAALPAQPSGASTQPSESLQSADPITRADGAALRVVSWNAELGALVSRPEPFVRTLNALAADVILMQELTDKVSEEQVRAVLEHVGGGDAAWNIMIGKGGGNLRCAIFTRLPIESIVSLDLVTYPEQPDRSVRVTSGVVLAGSKRLLVASVHLKCCGRDGSSEDVTRLAEVDIIHAALKTAASDASADGLVIAGDFNLVGSRGVVENMMTGLDFDGSTMEAVDAMQIDQRSNATWSDRRQPFLPGRLDWALYSDSRLRMLKCFVYDSADIAANWHEAHGTEAGDTAAASDHLPVVFDVAWR